MLKFGIISEFDATKGLARVQFDQDNIVSKWIPVLVKKSLKDKYSYHFDIQEHVACMMDENLEDGVVLGAVYSDNETPSGGAENITNVTFENGAAASYDRENEVFTASVGTTRVTIDGNQVVLNQDSNSVTVTSSEITITDGTTTVGIGADGVDISKGGESLKAIIDDLITECINEKHAHPQGPTTANLSSAQFLAIQTRVATLLS